MFEQCVIQTPVFVMNFCNFLCFAVLFYLVYLTLHAYKFEMILQCDQILRYLDTYIASLILHKFTCQYHMTLTLLTL